MPIEILTEKKRTWIHFGTGDIHIADAKLAGGPHCVVFHEMTPHEIGSSAPELHGTSCDDFAVGMTFSRPESIDAVIAVLLEFKANHFPSEEARVKEVGK